MRGIPGRSIAVACLLIAAGGCALASARGSDADDASFEREVGTASRTDAVERSLKVLQLHQFVVRDQRTDPDVYIETLWRDRAPFEDEQALGIIAAQSRAIVRTNRRGALAIGDLLAVLIKVENRVRIRGSNEWTQASATKQYKAWADRIAEDLQRELQIGVRKF